MSDFEILSILLTVVSIVIAVISLMLKLFAFLDNRYKRK